MLNIFEKDEVTLKKDSQKLIKRLYIHIQFLQTDLPTFPSKNKLSEFGKRSIEHFLFDDDYSL